MRFLVAGVVVAFLLGCGGSGTRTVKQPDRGTQLATVDRAAQMFVGVGKVIMAAGQDCDAMAKNVVAWITAHAAERARVNATLAKVTSDALKRRYRDHLNTRLDVVIGMKAGVEGCQAHSGFAAAWARLDR